MGSNEKAVETVLEIIKQLIQARPSTETMLKHEVETCMSLACKRDA